MALHEFLPAEKRVTVIGQFIAIVFLSAVFFQIRIIESNRYTEDFQIITGLANFVKLSVHKTLISHHKTNDEFFKAFHGDLQNTFIEWLHKEHKDIDESRRRVRDSITKWLGNYGLSSDELADLTGKGYREKIPFLAFYSPITPFRSVHKEQADIILRPPINLLLDELEYLSSSTNIQIAIDLKEQDFPILKFSLSQGHFSQGTYEVTSAILKEGNKLVFTFVENTGLQQRLPERQTVEVPVVTETIENVSWLDIINASKQIHQIKTILLDKASYNGIKYTYGRMRIDHAEQFSTQRMLESYQYVEMLGFKFSPQYFWVYVFIFNIAFLISTAIHIRLTVESHAGEPTVLALNYLIRRKLGRVLLWCIIPVVSILLTYPQQSWSGFVTVVYWIATVIILCLGIIVYSFSERTSAPER